MSQKTLPHYYNPDIHHDLDITKLPGTLLHHRIIDAQKNAIDLLMLFDEDVFKKFSLSFVSDSYFDMNWEKQWERLIEICARYTKFRHGVVNDHDEANNFLINMDQYLKQWMTQGAGEFQTYLFHECIKNYDEVTVTFNDFDDFKKFIAKFYDQFLKKEIQAGETMDFESYWATLGKDQIYRWAQMDEPKPDQEQEARLKKRM